MSVLRVGAGKACITPAPEMYPLPVSHEKFPKTAAYNDLHVRAVAIDNGNERVMLVAYELAGVPSIPNEELRAKVGEAAGFPPEHILILATHNHTDAPDRTFLPVTDPGEEKFYQDFREIELNGAIEAAAAAVRTMREARYGYGECESYVNCNRDLQTPFGYWVEGQNPAGYSDKTLAVIKFIDNDGQLIAALLNHGTHANCAFGDRDVDGQVKTHSNFTGIACEFVERRYGGGAVAMWTSGAAGNQNPLNVHGMQYEYPDGYSTNVRYPDGVALMQMEQLGRTHGADAVKCLESITAYSRYMPVTHVVSSVQLPAFYQDPSDPTPHPFRMGGSGLRDMEKTPYGQVPPVPKPPRMLDKEPVEMKMQLVLLGDIALIFVSGELYAELGTALKQASPYRKAIVITHVDTHSAGYILDKGSKDHKVFQAFFRIRPGFAEAPLLEAERSLFDEALKERQMGAEI